MCFLTMWEINPSYTTVLVINTSGIKIYNSLFSKRFHSKLLNGPGEPFDLSVSALPGKQARDLVVIRA